MKKKKEPKQQVSDELAGAILQDLQPNPIIQQEETSHAKYSPSGLRSKEICPAFENADSGPGVEAKKGSDCHRYVDLYIQADDKAVQEAEALYKTFDEVQKKSVELVINYLNDFLKESTWARSEHKLDLRFLNAPGCDFGTADLILGTSTPKEIHLMDWKFGVLEVDDAEKNIQVQAYALAAMREFGAEICHMHILQPKRNEVSTHDLLITDLPKLVLRVKTIVARASVQNPDECPCDDVCIWCRKLATCKRVREYALVAAPRSLPGDGYLSSIAESGVEKVRQMLMAKPELASQLQSLALVMEKWAEETKSMVVSLATEGHEIPGFKLVQTTGRRTCLDNVALYQHLRVNYGVTPELFLTWCQVGLSKVESELGSMAPRGSKGKAAEQVAQEIAELGIVQSGHPVTYLRKKK